MIISEIQSKRAYCSWYSSTFKTLVDLKPPRHIGKLIVFEVPQVVFISETTYMRTTVIQSLGIIQIMTPDALVGAGGQSLRHIYHLLFCFSCNAGI